MTRVSKAEGGIIIVGALCTPGLSNQVVYGTNTIIMMFIIIMLLAVVYTSIVLQVTVVSEIIDSLSGWGYSQLGANESKSPRENCLPS